MAIIILIVFVFIAVAIFLFFRAERIQKQLNHALRELGQSRKLFQSLNDAIAITASKNEEFSKFRFKQLEERIEARKLPLTQHAETISPLIQNYAHIFCEVAGKKAQLKPVAQKCYDSIKKGSYKGFITFINGQEKHLKRMWANDSLNGFISLVESLILDLEKQVIAAEAKVIKEKARKDRAAKEQAEKDLLAGHKISA